MFCTRFGLIAWVCLLMRARQLVATGDPSDACPFWSDGSYLDGFCYKLVSTSSKNWTKAQQSCGNMTHSGRLAEPRTSLQFVHVLNLLKTTSLSKCVWLGVKRVDVIPGRLSSFAWVSQGDSLASDLDGHVNVSFQGSHAALECLNFTSNGQFVDETDCNHQCHYVCEQYVGQLCQSALPGGEFHQGQCYRWQATPLLWSEVQTFCSDSNASLAEPNTQETFNFVQNLSRHHLYTIHTLGTDEFFDTDNSYRELLADFQVTLYIKSCGEVFILLSDSHFSSSHSDMLQIFLQGNDRIHSLSRCEGFRTNCNVISLTHTSEDILVCDGWQKFLFEWSDDVVIVSLQAQTDTVLFVQAMTSVPAISYLGFSVTCASGAEIIIGENTPNDKSVLLGAMYDVESGSYTWPNSQVDVSSSLWGVGQPNTWTGHDNHTGLLTPAMTLHSLDATGNAHRFICQRHPFLYSYFAVVPTGGVDSVAPNLVISTERLELVYLSVTETTDTASSTTSGWLTRDVPYIQTLNKDIQLSGMGLHRKYAKIKATHLVTVHLISTTRDYFFATAVLPKGMLTTQYMMTTLPEVTGSTNQFTVTAVDAALTDVDIYFSCRNLSVLLMGWEMVRPSYASVTLTRFQSIMIQTEADFTGTVITATSPIVVFVGFSSASRHSFMQAFPTSASSWSQYVAVSPNSDLNPAAMLSEDLGVRVQALHTEAVLESMGPNVDLRDNGGYAWDMAFPNERYVIVHGDHPMIAIASSRIADDLLESATSSSSSCLMPILAQELWKDDYSVCLDSEIGASLDNFICIVFDKAIEDSMRYNDNPLNGSATCQGIEDTSGMADFMGCVIHLEQQCWSVDSGKSGASFVAYIFVHSSDDMLCYPAGFGSLSANAKLHNIDETELLSIPTSCTEKISETTTEMPATTTTETTTLETTTTTTTTTTTSTLTTSLMEYADAGQLAAEIKQDLEIDVMSTSRYRRKKKSIPDTRTSSMAIGLAGIGFCACAWVFVLILDIGKIGLHRHNFKK